jgi:glycogen debranching enzyme
LDDLERHTHVRFSRQPDGIQVQMPPTSQPTSAEQGIMIPVVAEPGSHPIIHPPRVDLTWQLNLPPHTPVAVTLHLYPEELGEGQPDPPFDRAVREARSSYGGWQGESSEISTSSESFTRLLARSGTDLRVLSQQVVDGYFPAAGIPWYAAPFGRDSLITALQTLILNPDLARGTLRLLARFQGRTVAPWREEEPGKILHEMRFGEMARLKMVPHTPYFGTVDATPLFVMLFVETMRWLGDEQLYADLLPNVLLAVEWIDKYGDVDGDGFVEYRASTSSGGIRNQIWKDSGDSTQFPDGTLAETPIAACEVQGYVYAAKQGLSALLAAHGEPAQAARLAEEAARLKDAFNATFWMPDADFFAQGLDAGKRPIPTITSNPGHCLWTGIADTEKAAAVARRLVAPDMASGWGVRTISSHSPSYNPMSYHNGSIWPHDNSILMAGLRRYGFRAETLNLATQLYQASLRFRYYRLPELFCGFDRDDRYGAGPAEYPVSCSPQAWAAGAPVLLLQSLLGLEPGGPDAAPRVDAWLPDWLDEVTVRNLRAGARRWTVQTRRAGEEVVVNTEAQAR